MQLWRQSPTGYIEPIARQLPAHLVLQVASLLLQSAQPTLARVMGSSGLNIAQLAHYLIRGDKLLLPAPGGFG